MNFVWLLILGGKIYLKDSFFQYWFKGFEKAISDMDEKNSKMIFSQCGKACSDSYTKQIYIDEYECSENINDFLTRLKNRFPEIEFKIIKDNKIVLLTYHHCACDLVRKGYIKTPLLCECSRQSLLYNWETVIGKQNVKINLLGSILNGDNCCEFEIHLK